MLAGLSVDVPSGTQTLFFGRVPPGWKQVGTLPLQALSTTARLAADGPPHVNYYQVSSYQGSHTHHACATASVVSVVEALLCEKL